MTITMNGRGRDLETRMKYTFIETYKPVMADEPFRAFKDGRLSASDAKRSFRFG